MLLAVSEESGVSAFGHTKDLTCTNWGKLQDEECGEGNSGEGDKGWEGN